MQTYVVAASALEGARYARLVGCDPRRTHTVLWPGELAAADPEEARVVFLRGWCDRRSQPEVDRTRVCAQRLAARGAAVLHDDLDEDTAIRIARHRLPRAA